MLDESKHIYQIEKPRWYCVSDAKKCEDVSVWTIDGRIDFPGGTVPVDFGDKKFKVSNEGKPPIYDAANKFSSFGEGCINGRAYYVSAWNNKVPEIQAKKDGTSFKAYIADLNGFAWSVVYATEVAVEHNTSEFVDLTQKEEDIHQRQAQDPNYGLKLSAGYWDISKLVKKFEAANIRDFSEASAITKGVSEWNEITEEFGESESSRLWKKGSPSRHALEKEAKQNAALELKQPHLFNLSYDCTYGKQSTAHWTQDQKDSFNNIDKLLAASRLISQAEQQLEAWDGKLLENTKQTIDEALSELKAIRAAEDLAQIDAAIEKLEKSLESASKEIQAATQQGP